MRIVTAKEMTDLEAQAKTEYGLTAELIIESIGLRIAGYLNHNYLSEAGYGEIVVLVGKGNNGADALSVARHLRRFGHAVRAFCLFPIQEMHEGLTHQLDRARAYGVKVTELNSHEELHSYFTQTQSRYFVVDGILGTGVRLPLSNFLFDVIETINKSSDVVVSIDIPTGVCSDTGLTKGNAIHADLTLAIGVPKLGHYLSDGAELIGSLKIIDAGLPNELLISGDKKLLTTSHVSFLAATRNPFAHKNTFGHTLVIGGAPGKTGALLLAAKAALKVGSGLVTAMTWEENYTDLVSRVEPEVMTDFFPEDLSLIDKRLKYLERFDAVVIGPGMGKSPRTREVVLKAIQSYHGPLIIDADAINVLSFSKDRELLARRKAPTVFTPHIGEFSRYMNCHKTDLYEKPLYYVKNFIDGTNCSLVLKGPSTFLGFPSNKLFVSYMPNAGMATGGTGDVFAGVVGGLVAQFGLTKQKLSPLDEIDSFKDAVCLGTTIHSLAGRAAAKEMGERSMTAGKIADYFGHAFEELRGKRKIYDYEHHIFEETE